MRRKIQPIRTVVPAKAGPLHNSGARPRSWQERIRSNPFAELSNPDCLPGIPNLSPEDGRPELCKGPAFAGNAADGYNTIPVRFIYRKGMSCPVPCTAIALSI